METLHKSLIRIRLAHQPAHSLLIGVTFQNYPKNSTILSVNHTFKVEYHANENPLNNSEKIAYVSQRLMYPIIIKNNTLPH